MNRLTNACMVVVATCLSSFVFSSAQAATLAVKQQSGAIDASGNISFDSFDTKLGMLDRTTVEYSSTFSTLYFFSPSQQIDGSTASVTAGITTRLNGSAIDEKQSIALVSLPPLSSGEEYFYQVDFRSSGLATLLDQSAFVNGKAALSFAFANPAVSGLPEGSTTMYFAPSVTSGQATLTYYYAPAETPLVAAVPEPATWAMMLVGFGMVAGAARYRRRSVVASLA